MLFESVAYHGSLPFEISFLNVSEENKHCHKELEILLVLRGVTHYQIYHMDYELNPGDLIIADVEDLHQIHDSSEDILLLSMHVDTKRFETIYPNIRYMFFVCEECMEGPSSNKQILQSKVALLKHRIAKLAFDYTEDKKDSSKLAEGINDLVSILVNHFQGFFMEDYQYKTGQENLSPVDHQRLSGITRYILLNYNKKITLDDVSKMEHLSSYYVSHLIKKTLGFNFQNFVNAIRLEFAEKFLVFSNLTLMQISEECGFSSPNYFNKCFSAWHGKTPAQYRKDYHPCERSYMPSFTADEAMALLTPYLNLPGNPGEAQSSIPNRIMVAIEEDCGQYQDFWSGYAPEVMIDSMEDVMRLGYYESKLKQIRPRAFFLDEGLMKHSRELYKSMEGILSHFSVPILSCGDMGLKRSEENAGVAANVSSAFDHIFNDEGSGLFLFGQGNALFTPHGLATPLYFVYHFFAGLDNPEAVISKHHAVVRSGSSLCILLFNAGPHGVLNVMVKTDGLPEEFFLLRTEILESDNCYAAVSDLGSPPAMPELLKKRIDSASAGGGKTYYSQVNRTENPTMDFMIYHNTVTILEIIEAVH